MSVVGQVTPFGNRSVNGSNGSTAVGLQAVQLKNSGK
jgi:hypothetical protein